mmetsp:Transcript_58206/g.65083  ORF Transcript_58206/g.65083 Transcript_58206/m.65083 type:complete len:165 (-) Transcript_58206:213-707(-)
MSFVAARNLTRTLAVRRCSPATTGSSSALLGRAVARTTQNNGSIRLVQSVPKVGTEAEMQAEVIQQIRARIAYQKEVLAANPHKSHDEEWDELWTWIKISFYVCVPGCLLMLVKDYFIEEHHHKPDGPLPEYMSIRKSEFPWECENCPFFDLECWKACQEEKKA